MENGETEMKREKNNENCSGKERDMGRLVRVDRGIQWLPLLFGAWISREMGFAFGLWVIVCYIIHLRSVKRSVQRWAPEERDSVPSW